MSLTRELETLFFILIASAISLLAVFYIRQPKHFIPNSVSLPSFVSINLTPTPTPVIVSPTPKVTTASWTSSDGTRKLTMETVLHTNNTKTYTFTVTDESSHIDISIFTQTVTDTENFSIPFNAFSPDNMYVYITKTGSDMTHYFVFQSSGQPFPNGELYLDISSLFAAHTTTYTLTEVTGWAAPTLLVLNTKTADKNTGPSFWFDVTTKGFIQLATLFN